MSQRFTDDELAKCARREVGMRRRVYPRWVEARRLTQQEADAEIAKMEAIARLLEDRAWDAARLPL